ncbi:hypothetical protein DFH07DRAFT_844671 [Mycena maculata]|uniref:Secreted protein n=1 Tax=Mycena maculata TaxID=230809 RepID=A0AAD7I5U4_9AGAR|nr:hypothetical protein DFH07DRAFT_844671 [Mycena maculata]
MTPSLGLVLFLQRHLLLTRISAFTPPAAALHPPSDIDVQLLLNLPTQIRIHMLPPRPYQIYAPPRDRIRHMRPRE